MNWSSVLGHDEQVERFRRANDRGRLATSFLFVGPSGVGKRTFARQLAKTLLCEQNDGFDACGRCAACVQVAASTHPDLIEISKPAERSFIPIELFIGDREHRNRDGLCHHISLTPFCGGRKVAIIDDADFLNIEGANCLLKTLEEPPHGSVLILIGTSVQKQLPTILSRCQVVHFQSLAESQVEQLLRDNELVDSPQIAATLAARSGGSVQAALAAADEEARQFRDEFLSRITSDRWNGIELADEVRRHVEQAGKDSQPQRERLRQLAGAATEHFRQLMRNSAGAGGGQRHASWNGGAEQAIQCALCCIETEEHIAANANIKNLIEWWLHELYVCSHK
ncbi:MAG: DNA polymerase III subunit [Pirellulaceae bacterium]|jgi:DNA polymerase-3 subunit delta'|nr:DNA polymerase III subunit [Pirellulaceae bacterium]MDP7020388.1 DNA polymerase III subunit [Pirellulaceae bacterium]